MTALQTAVLDLADARDFAFAGGKAVNLAELIGAGFPVPDGFCVGTPAYAQAADTAGIAALLDGPDLPARARDALLATPIPDDVAAAVTAAYLALGEGAPVAVRSSATAEDLPGASFAGQQDTYLNVVGVAALLDAVRRCWASLWTDRAVAYRADAGIPHAGTQLAVVVQRMVDARAAGVLFTADPISGRRSRSVLDAAAGLGDAVVSGAVDPDHWVVDGRAITSGPAAGGCLTDRQVRDLVELGRRVEAHFGAPQDIEWALDGEGTLWLTQSRAITTLYPVPPSRRPGLRVHLNASLAQGLTRPITPMGISAFRVIGASLAELATGRPVDPMDGPAGFGIAGDRAFIDITAALRNAIGRKAVPAVFGVMEARSAVVVRGLLAAEPSLAPTRSALPGAVAFARPVLRILLRYRVPALIALGLVRPAAARKVVAARGAQLRARLAEPVAGDEHARLAHVVTLLRAVPPIMPRTVPAAAGGFLALGLARRVAGPDLDAQTVHEVLRGLPYNVTTDMDLELWALATRLDQASTAALHDATPAELAGRFHARALPPVLQRELAAFLAEHGHRTAAEIDLGMPRWSDNPTQVLGSLANYLRITEPADHPDARFARGAAAAEAAVAQVVGAVRRRSRVRAWVTGLALRRTRQLAGMRETHKDYLVRVLAHARAQLAILGAELAGRGLLAAADDVFFLELREVAAALDGVDQRGLVADRRAEYDRELRRRHIPRVLLSDGTEPEAEHAGQIGGPAPEGALVGSPASAGTVTGVVRVVLDPADAHLEPGEILVAPSTDPGWTPLFLTAGGLVMEMGGSNSHGAVVAREYGIPAVVGVPDATGRLRTGQTVTVDGAAGTVVSA
ncbi:MAG TPA: PEP/pyruvate-binding domain-containing protein [Pseudonocardia sp.]|nr:PEP/pyruvate-binding domain-containing protein [Pseudonocardia sp.]